ncbi:MAG: hypothetical protein ACRDJH_20030 [Thermomicrobiales bacterium]
MITRFVADLYPPISRARLERYRSGDGSDLDMVINYLWNSALGEALYCSLSAVEVTLRNTLHDTLTNHFGTSTWYDLRLLDYEQTNHVARAKAAVRGYGRQVTPGRVVSELTFGFWVTILSRNYDSRLWRGVQGAPLKTAFPRIPKRLRQRGTIHQRYNDIRKLRNRVFHFEPIWDRPYLLAEHQAIYEAIAWISPPMRDAIALVDRFPIVYQNERGRIEPMLREHLKIT